MKIDKIGKAEPLSKNDFNRLFQLMPKPFSIILAVCWFTTERAGAVVQVKIDHAYHGQKVRDTLLIPGSIRKDKKTREVPVHKALRQILAEYQHDRGSWLFPSQLNPDKHVALQVYGRQFRSGCSKLGLIGYSTHSVRRGAITQLAKHGVNSRHIQALTGHSSLQMVQQYCDVSREDLVSVVDLL